MNHERSREIEEQKLSPEHLDKVTPEEADLIVEAEDVNLLVNDTNGYLKKETAVKNTKTIPDLVVTRMADDLNRESPEMDTLSAEADELTKKHNAKKLS